MNLQEEINKQVAKQFESGYVTELVEKYAKQSIENEVKELFDHWGPVTKQIKEWLKENFKLDFSQISLPEYNQYVIEVIEGSLGEILKTQTIEPITEMLKLKTQSLEKTNWKLSEIVNKLKEDWFNFDGEGECFCEVKESSYGFKYIYLDKDSNSEIYKCSIKINLNKENKVWHFENDGINSVLKNPPIGTVDTFLFQLFAQGATIEIDKFDTEYYRD